MSVGWQNNLTPEVRDLDLKPICIAHSTELAQKIVFEHNSRQALVDALKCCEMAFSALYPSTVIVGRNHEHDNEIIAVSDLQKKIRAALKQAGEQ